MKIETAEDGAVWIKVTVKDLARYHSQGKALYLVDATFAWRDQDEALELVATPEDFFGEIELDFAEEYLLLHGTDEIAYPWEPLDSETLQ